MNSPIFTLGWGHRTKHHILLRITYYLESGGGTPHKKMCSDVHTGVGTPHRIQRQRGDTAQNQSRLLAGWLAGWLDGWVKSDYSANPGSNL